MAFLSVNNIVCILKNIILFMCNWCSTYWQTCSDENLGQHIGYVNQCFENIFFYLFIVDRSKELFLIIPSAKTSSIVTVVRPTLKTFPTKWLSLCPPSFPVVSILENNFFISVTCVDQSACTNMHQRNTLFTKLIFSLIPY